MFKQTVKEFIDWVQQQDFAADTTIVISGDHQTMDSDFCEDVDKDYERRVYTTYINADAEKQTEKKRKYTIFDDFPTTLSAMGAQIEGDRLGLGTNLFSAKETLSEKEGVTAEYNKMLKKSKLMEKLSDIDEEEYRRKEEEKVSPTADVKIKKTGKDNQVLIKVENIEHLKKGLQSITAAVWKNEDQSDLQWVNLAVFENGICKTKVDLSNYEPMQGEYNVHIYIIDGKGDAHNVAGTTFEIK